MTVSAKGMRGIFTNIKSTIYFFSGTGNSLATARRIGSALEPQAEILSMAKLYYDSDIRSDSEVIGFVFPIFMGDAPWVVKEFVKKINIVGSPYIFAVATCNDNPGKCLPIFRELWKRHSQTLSLGEIVSMPGSGKISSPEENEERLRASAERSIAVAQKVNRREKGTGEPGVGLSGKKVAGSPRKKLDIAFTRFKVSALCDGCGICRRICPMGNVELENKKPIWNRHCAACLACFHWCPQKAITFRLPILGNRPRYRHPDITIKDIAAQQPSHRAGGKNPLR